MRPLIRRYDQGPAWFPPEFSVPKSVGEDVSEGNRTQSTSNRKRKIDALNGSQAEHKGSTHEEANGV